MPYTWEEETLKKYGKENTSRLIKEQQEYEKECGDNDCKTCGKENEGTIVKWRKDRPVLMHAGLWIDAKCKNCGRYMD